MRRQQPNLRGFLWGLRLSVKRPPVILGEERVYPDILGRLEGPGLLAHFEQAGRNLERIRPSDVRLETNDATVVGKSNLLE